MELKMRDLTVGGARKDGASSRFVDAWHRAERGEFFPGFYLAFESEDVVATVGVTYAISGIGRFMLPPIVGECS